MIVFLLPLRDRVDVFSKVTFSLSGFPATYMLEIGLSKNRMKKKHGKKTPSHSHARTTHTP